MKFIIRFELHNRTVDFGDEFQQTFAAIDERNQHYVVDIATATNDRLARGPTAIMIVFKAAEDRVKNTR